MNLLGGLLDPIFGRRSQLAQPEPAPMTARETVAQIAAPLEPLVPVASEIVAWRGWRLERDGPDDLWLASPYQHMRWEGPVVTAPIRPARDTSDGFYALRTPDDLGDGYAPHVLGQVALSGIVAEGSTGYRAERCVVRALWVWRLPFPNLCALEAVGYLASRYQCEVAFEPEVGQEITTFAKYRADSEARRYLWSYPGAPPFHLARATNALQKLGIAA